MVVAFLFTGLESLMPPPVLGAESTCAKYQVNLESEDWGTGTAGIHRRLVLQSVGYHDDFDGLWLVTSYDTIQIYPKPWESSSGECCTDTEIDNYHMTCETKYNDRSSETHCVGYGYHYSVEKGQVQGPLGSSIDVSRACKSILSPDLAKKMKMPLFDIYPHNTAPVGRVDGSRMNVEIDGFILNGEIKCLEKSQERKRRVKDLVHNVIKGLNTQYVGSKRIEKKSPKPDIFPLEYEVIEFSSIEIDTSNEPARCILGDNLFQIWQTEKKTEIRFDDNRVPHPGKRETLVGYFDGELFYNVSEFQKFYPSYIYEDPPTVKEEVDFAIDVALFAISARAPIRGLTKRFLKKCPPSIIASRFASKSGTQKLLPLNHVPNAGGKIISYVTKKDEVFYRVFSGNSTVGSFLTKVPPKSSQQAIQGLALPPGNKAEFLQKVIVPAGTRVQRSRALSAFGQRGGLEQFQLLDKIPAKNFGPGVSLK